MRSPTEGYGSALPAEPIPTAHRDRYQGSVFDPVPAFCAYPLTTDGADVEHAGPLFDTRHPPDPSKSNSPTLP